jgi:radical SAM superfamily enzyme YgiQ (UPF0313 family)
MMNLSPTDFRIVLISTYEMGRQPFGLASPLAWLREKGFAAIAVDCAVQSFPAAHLKQADLVAFYLPMHTATRIAAELITKAKAVNPGAYFCCYGLYATLNEDFLRQLGIQTLIGGEFEAALTNLAVRLYQSKSGKPLPTPSTEIALDRLKFLPPDRTQLPDPTAYARLCMPDGSTKLTGYTEASRGCKYHCRHCPVVPVYGGRFRVVPPEIVLQDVAAQVAAGAEHITFGDPDFFNGPTHALKIVEQIHRQFPNITYDVTIKISHLRKHRKLLPRLKDTGCLFVTSAVEAVDNEILTIFDKGHSREDFIETVNMFREVGLILNPTFVAFNPWITLNGYRELLNTLAGLQLIEQVAPIQLAIRLLLPSGSLLLIHPAMQPHITGWHPEKLTYEWQHPNPKMDELQLRLIRMIPKWSSQKLSRTEIFTKVWETVNIVADEDEPMPDIVQPPRRTETPYLNEPWYC